MRRQHAQFTIHAGEALPPRIWEAIQHCGAERLGHGVRGVDDLGRRRGGPPPGAAGVLRFDERPRIIQDVIEPGYPALVG
ncbi:hypothetical protein GCM10025787_13140 [Saccharopolyspora rosea]